MHEQDLYAETMQHIILSETDKACMDCARGQKKNEWIRKCDWQAFLFPTLLHTRHRISSSSGILFCFVWEVKECLTSLITPFLPLKQLKQWNFYKGKRVVKVRMSVWSSVSMRRWGSQPKQHQGNNSNVLTMELPWKWVSLQNGYLDDANCICVYDSASGREKELVWEMIPGSCCWVDGLLCLCSVTWFWRMYL